MCYWIQTLLVVEKNSAAGIQTNSLADQSLMLRPPGFFLCREGRKQSIVKLLPLKMYPFPLSNYAPKSGNDGLLDTIVYRA